MIELSVSFVEYPKEIKDLAGKDHQLLLTSQKKRKSSFLLEKTTPLKYFCQKIRAEPKSAQALIFVPMYREHRKQGNIISDSNRV